VYTAMEPVDIFDLRVARRRCNAAKEPRFKLTLEPSLSMLAGPFTRPGHVIVSGLESGKHGAAHEAPFSTEQPPSQEDPRLPCAHGHQGRTTRAEPAQGQGPQASVGLTTGQSRPGSLPAAYSLPRGRRLTDKPQFDAVHRAGIRVSDPLFMVIARPNGLEYARLGLAVGVKAAGNAVNRNRIKRVVRESFRRESQLPALDIVVNARAVAGKATNAELTTSIAGLWTRITQRCARS
jgi:ribonuclease P protein component